jgi:hypothetical protein
MLASYDSGVVTSALVGTMRRYDRWTGSWKWHFAYQLLCVSLLYFAMQPYVYA